jgi:D-alanyl-lipoteichoic acid acyltransferase DltB (MBOAT superfamily)
MLFNSVEFLIFFPITLIIGNILKGFWQRLFLLAASYYFYMAWNKYFIALIVASTLLDYFVALWLEKIPDEKTSKRKWVLTMSMVGNIGFLAFFKYTNFFLEVIQDTGLFSPDAWTRTFHSPLGITCGPNVDLQRYACDITLPVGISFYTFQSMSYTIDVYRKKQEARKSIVDFALYVAFFPQLVAGPIVRGLTFFRDLDARLNVTREDIQIAFTRILIGLTRKVVFADNLAKVVDSTFIHYANMNSLEIWVGAIAFGWQIYFDFAGYTDIAIGVARLFGFKFDANFNFPMVTDNINDHWSKWHISFSTWIRDYIFIPLGGSRVSEWKVYRNIFITWFFAGVWHGAAYHFIGWGLWQGFMLAVYREYSKTKFWTFFNEKGGIAYNLFSRVFTMFCLGFGFVMFRAPTMKIASEMMEKMLLLKGANIDRFINYDYALLLGVCFVAGYIFSKRNLEYYGEHAPDKLMYVNIASIFLLIFFGVTESQNFLYFAF